MKWTNRPGHFSIELEYVPELGVFDSNGKPLPMLNDHLKEDGELVINWLSTGYYEPASMYGGPDNLGHPDEGEDERTLNNAYIHVFSPNKLVVEIPKDVQAALFDIYEKKIVDQDVPEYDY
jgi:hypothetical protein